MLSAITGLPGYYCGWMGKDTGSWHHQQCPPHQAPNLKCKSFAPDSGWPNAFPACARPCTGLVSANETIPGCVSSNPPHFKAGLANVPRGWFYGLPCYRQALTPIHVHSPKDPDTNADGYKRNATLNAVSRPVEKKYIVFDHSGNQTRLIFSPATGYPIQCPRFGNPSEVDNGGLGIEWKTKTRHFYKDCQIFFDGLVEKPEDQETGEESEMHEDTEELNALLYSDEDSSDDHECSCEEEISTGHSPSKMTGHMKQEVASAEEVASSGGGNCKRKRLLDDVYSASSLMDTASSGKPNGSSEYEDDAESCCGESKIHGEEFSSLPTNKRLKREKIRETVNILQNIIPGGKDMDAILVLDEAIQYLRSLKLKAKSLGESL
ncbi:hypothetical protein IFM89_014248 [Coptis chinensis]|uniref:BHLH domain-containing protein n=1 Tax=Coptis chinensis TaxID=261450 RepID=A0A835IQA7_9MAGN|nr:hypothetical protein IFM89_014248 [Coptis chinensis]